MERVAGEGPASAGAAGKNAKGAAAAKKAAKEVRLLVPGKSGGSDADGTGDPGGALDPGAAVGETYVYRVQRVRTVAVGGHTVAVRGPMSEPVEVRMRDVFPPGAPTGLAGIPACVEGKLGVDLSWEANGESDLAGYFVYRAEGLDGAAWTKRMERPERPLEAPAFRDPDVGGGGVRYRVTAVDRAGNESAPSAVFSVAGEELRSVSCPAPR